MSAVFSESVFRDGGAAVRRIRTDRNNRSEDHGVLLCHSESVRSACVCVCPVIFSFYLPMFLRAPVFKPDWLDVYTSEGG